MGFEFTSEVLRQIQHQLESRDDRGRPLILASDAKLIADTVRQPSSSLAGQMESGPSSSRFAESPLLKPLIAACSRRVLSRIVESFDPRQPDRFHPAGALDDLVQVQSRSLLEESLARRELSEAIAELLDLDTAIEQVFAKAFANTQHYGSDRRTLLFVPNDGTNAKAIEKLQLAMPLAASVPAATDDVVVISEAAGISPRVLAHEIECVPGHRRRWPAFAHAT